MLSCGETYRVLLTASDGTVGMWLMNGLSIADEGVVSGANGFWPAIGIGDLKGDGHSDIVVRGADGSFGAWLMNGTAVVGGGVIASAAAATLWSFAGTGDLTATVAPTSCCAALPVLLLHGL